MEKTFCLPLNGMERKLMTKKILALGLLSLGFSSQVFASYGTGYSSYPMMSDKKFFSTEVTGITSTGGGVGAQVRYGQKINSALLIDAGVGISGGERTNRIFAGADYEIFPDYLNQPRVSVKTTITNAEEFGTRRNILSIAPTVSKGFSFWGYEAFPFVSIPMGLSLESGSKTYETISSFNVGITGNLPIERYSHLTGTLEAIVDLKDSYSGVFMGVSFPIE